MLQTNLTVEEIQGYQEKLEKSSEKNGKRGSYKIIVPLRMQNTMILRRPKRRWRDQGHLGIHRTGLNNITQQSSWW
jgi:hypothetical protein